MKSPELVAGKVELRIAEIISEKAGVLPEQVASDSTLKDLNLDSLDIVEIAMIIEEEFQISIPDEKIDFQMKVGQIADYVSGRVQN